MFKIIFAVAFLSQSGAQYGHVAEPTKFQTNEECMTFGREMTPRVADWVRGRIEAEWDVPVSVHFACEVDGNPA